ncbi:MAG: type II toxin-antitoxin system RelE/ParE family toxin [Pseudomonadota bacterium]
MIEIEILEYVNSKGKSPFSIWFNRLRGINAEKIATALYRMSQRIYFGQDNDRLIILLGGGTKKQQGRDIKQAKLHWRDYKQCKKKKR